MWTISIIVLAVVTLLNLFLGIFVLRKNYHSSVNLSYFLFTLGISGWAVTNAIFQATDNESFAYIIAIIAYYAGIFIALPFFYLTLVFPVGFSIIKNWYKWLIYIWGIIWFVLISIPDITLKAVSITNSVKGLITGPGLFFHFISILLLMFGGIIILIRKMFKARGVMKIQIKYVLLGVFIMTFFGILLNLILPLTGNYSLVWMGPMFSVFVLLTTAYSILKHRLFDIYFILTEGVVISALVITLLLVFTTSQSLLIKILEADYTTFSSFLIVILAFIPLKNFYYDKFKKYVFKKAYRYGRALTDIEMLVKNSDYTSLDEFLQAILKKTEEIMEINSSGAVIFTETDHFITKLALGLIKNENIITKENILYKYFKDNQDEILNREETDYRCKNENLSDEKYRECVSLTAELTKLKCDIAVPVSFKNELIAILFFTAKKSGVGYTIQDYEILSNVSKSISHIFELKRVFDGVKQS